MRRTGDKHLCSADRRLLKLKVLAASVFLVLAFLSIYAIGRWLETGSGLQDARGVLNGALYDQSEITYDGKTYEPKELTTVLVFGVDKSSGSSAAGYRNGGQADFMQLLIIDDKEKTVTPLQIDRDTMTKITVIGILGNESGTRNAQICLAHGFGDGGTQSCQLTLKAVSDLLMGVEIDNYFAMNLDGIPVLNDAVGGVTVTLKDDFSSLDPTMRKGMTLTLRGIQAEYYVRSRREIGSGTNERRMERQRVYLKALSDQMSVMVHSDQESTGRLFDTLEPYVQTDMKRGRIINEIWRTRDYRYLETVQIEGTYSISEDGFMEFHADEAALEKLVVDQFYQLAR